ncbi:MAG: pentapeptide repeat-containing protein [Coleofasciculaceae cyanobacterium]
MLAMRADFFGKCVEREYSGLAQRIQQNLVTVTPMQQEELRLAIVEPAKRVELDVEPELVTQMLSDVAGSPGSLPLLQYTLLELWNKRRDNCLQLATYSQLGGVMGTLQKRATEVYEQFSEEEKAAAKHIFLSLTQLGEGTEDTRRRVLKEDLVTSRHSERLIDRVVQKLADARLIVTHNPKSKILNPKSVVVDVAHEALIRHWILLREWLNESRGNLREKRKIEAVAEEWRGRGKAKDYLLQGRRLREAKEFQKEQVDGFALSKLAEEFIRVSVKQKQINRFRFIAGFLVIPLIGTGLVGFGIYREITIQRYRKVLIATKGSKYSEERIDAVQKLAWLREPLTSGLLEEANLKGVYLRRSSLREANLREANLRGANLREANLEEADLEEADLEEVSLLRTDLRGANLIRANLRGTILIKTNLSSTFLWDADISKAILWKANLSKGFLSEANFSGAYFRETDLHNANFSGTNLREANLTEAKNLTPAQVKAACNWQEAIYSDEFRKELDSSPDPEEKPDCSQWGK